MKILFFARHYTYLRNFESVLTALAERGDQVHVAVERDEGRVHTIATNASVLGVPHLEIVAGEAPEVFPALAGPPDAIFAGGGLAADGFLDA